MYSHRALGGYKENEIDKFHGAVRAQIWRISTTFQRSHLLCDEISGVGDLQQGQDLELTEQSLDSGSSQGTGYHVQRPKSTPGPLPLSAPALHTAGSAALSQDLHWETERGVCMKVHFGCKSELGVGPAFTYNTIPVFISDSSV